MSEHSHIRYKVVEIKRFQKCYYDELCTKFGCKFIHESKFEKRGDLVRQELKTIDLSKTKVCYFLDKCKVKRCKFAHKPLELELPKCKFGSLCKFKKSCRREHPVYEFAKICFLFEEMKSEIIFDKEVIPVLLQIFRELGFLTFDIEKLIIGFFPVFKVPKLRIMDPLF
jgi:hypothetical protein